MAYPYTDTGYNMFDMMSMMQKSVRRAKFELAGFASDQLKGDYRKTMWNRILVTSAEDCFGVITKELIALKDQDDILNNDVNISRALALMCKSKKSRDACYFACNFVLASRNSFKITPKAEDVKSLIGRIKNAQKKNTSYDSCGFQISIFGEEEKEEFDQEEFTMFENVCSLQMALDHRDMDQIGYYMDSLRKNNREILWDAFEDYSNHTKVNVLNEIKALRKTDELINKKKKDKDEIFISKASILLCYANDENIFRNISSSEIVSIEKEIDWKDYNVKNIKDCILNGGEIPEWVYDCHTLKGKRMGKTDWDMTRAEQDALYPLQEGYFDEASWIYTYEDDYKKGTISKEGMKPILEYAKTHEANPVKKIPY